jgi:hydrogenase maturation factor
MSECVVAHGCITCADEALPLRVLQVDGERDLALCLDPDGQRSSVEIGLLDAVMSGEVLLVHAGTALARAPEDPPRTAQRLTARAGGGQEVLA